MNGARALMFQGTGSDVGKSLMVAGLCRALTRRGLRVRPFKPQNMSNNAAVTADGGEIGRAQALQALACGVPPAIAMNPVLLKPQSETGAQLVVLGRVQGTMAARAYQSLKPTLLPVVLESFERLRSEADIVLVEGAGSPAEINLRAGDIANMGFALAAKVPVVLIGDIDRGGVIASLVGTYTVIAAAEQAQICGFIINKFRGDVSLFANGLSTITERTGWRSFGVVPWLPDAARLPAEDAMALARPLAMAPAQDESGRLRIAVPQLSRIANFDDFDPLLQEPGVLLTMIRPGQPIPAATNLIVLPGTKATLADLAFMRAQGWDIDIRAHCRQGGQVLGICGGYQMLGNRVEDPDGVEGPPGGANGLGLLNVSTILTRAKVLRETTGIDIASGTPVYGYEMHMGRTEGRGRARPMLRMRGLEGGEGVEGGTVSDCGRVRGCYLHGLFRSDPFRTNLINCLGGTASSLSFDAGIDAALDALAGHLERHLDVDALLAAAAHHN
ncbi:MAG: cobyric acid synthase [Rhodospirillaceae bacterium]